MKHDPLKYDSLKHWAMDREEADRTPVWLITYSDLMTLLLVLFVLLFSLSEFKQSEKFQGVARSFHAKFGHPIGPDDAAANLQAILSSNLRAAQERRLQLTADD